jgi:hypothetical protein
MQRTPWAARSAASVITAAIGAKQSTKTPAQDAYDAGARIVVNAPVEKVLIEKGEAKGVEATTADGHKVTVRARAVAAAAGAVHTPALLSRSGLDNPNVGKNLMIHPVLLVWAQFEEEILPWTGVFGSTFCDELLDLGEGTGSSTCTPQRTPPTSPFSLPGAVPASTPS